MDISCFTPRSGALKNPHPLKKRKAFATKRLPGRVFDDKMIKSANAHGCETFGPSGAQFQLSTVFLYLLTTQWCRGSFSPPNKKGRSLQKIGTSMFISWDFGKILVSLESIFWGGRELSSIGWNDAMNAESWGQKLCSVMTWANTCKNILILLQGSVKKTICKIHQAFFFLAWKFALYLHPVASFLPSTRKFLESEVHDAWGQDPHVY